MYGWWISAARTIPEAVGPGYTVPIACCEELHTEKILLKTHVFFFCLASFLSSHCVADESTRCPETVAIIQDNSLVEATLESFKAIYLQLGCKPKFVELPGRRGIMYFNKNLADGEFFRLPLAEVLYSRSFVRSDTPLFYISNTLWLHPDPKVRESLPLGYLLGVVWEEEYMKSRDGMAFYSNIEVYDAYQKGLISGFFDSSYLANTQFDYLDLQPAPVLGKYISKLPLFHYLGVEHAEFMGKVSEVLKTNNPYERVILPVKWIDSDLV